MTSIWWVTQCETNWSRVSVRGTPSTSASMLAREVGLQLGVLEQVVQHDAGDRVALEHDDQPLAGAARRCRRLTSAMPWILPESASSAIFSARLSGLTW